MLQATGPGIPAATTALHYRGDDLSTHHLERVDRLRADDVAADGLDAHAPQPPQLADALADLRTTGPDVEPERRGLLDRGVVAAFALAEGPEQVELAGDLRRRPQVAGVRLPGHERQGPPLAAARDQDRRVRPSHGLRDVQRAPEPDASTLERSAAPGVAGPHLETGLDRPSSPTAGSGEQPVGSACELTRYRLPKTATCQAPISR